MEIENMICPYVRLATDNILDITIPERIIYDYELLYIKEGEATISINKQKYHGVPGDVFLFKPGKRHSIKLGSKGSLRQPHIHFDLFAQDDSPRIQVNFRNYEDMTEDEIRNIRPDVTKEGSRMALPDKLNIRHREYFENLLFEVIHKFQTPRVFKVVGINGAFLRLWAYILQENSLFINGAVNPNLEKYALIREYIASHIDHAITLDELSNHFYISKFHLRKTFTEIYEVSPAEYGRYLRIQEARNLIYYSNLSITEIADQLGFSSLQAFNHTFRQICGTSPRQCRMTNGKKQETAGPLQVKRID